MQNIPSHNKEIRMLFKAGAHNIDVEVSDNDSYVVPKENEVFTTTGWKSALELSIGDKIEASDNTLEIIKNIIISDKNVEIYV